MIPSSIFYLAAAIYAYNPSDPNSEGNCKTGKYTFSKDRVLVIPPQTSDNYTVYDPSIYDFTLDYGYGYEFFPNGSISIKLKKPKFRNNNENLSAYGTRLSTTRFIKNARLEAKFSAVDVEGVLCSFITMSADKDEIDNEVINNHKEKNFYTTNIFSKGQTDDNAYRYALWEYATNPVNKSNVYTIDWNRERIIWEFEGIKMRSFKKGDADREGNYRLNGEIWYPYSPSKVQFSIWDTMKSDWAVVFLIIVGWPD
jgi:beta-glucanase (GH16 family)